ncbi:hypothetical protein BKG58_24545 [Mycobacteroides abscessus subsp. abscessus]|nr:hypothetical protein MAUC22_09910 [Mycobacteroides abscessus UC22]ALM19364.1 hypothetical protein AOY11_08605 [Mycobacteroides abscessus]OLT71883.1 hypothetical protein BKG55_08910 [Mycobacteroides abscessus ATCC 19977]OLT76886.1 hypothetical protein BKG58_24545 [Mycobacteroides abscessus subsp. abscessus]AMU48375.1 hypothetical protein A3O00_09730 [Mycobacteroides abscessus]
MDRSLNVRGDFCDVAGQDGVDNRGLAPDMAVHRRAGTPRLPGHRVKVQSVQSVARDLLGRDRHDAVGGDRVPIGPM